MCETDPKCYAPRGAAICSIALDVFQRRRLGLHAELGLEPSPVLLRLQRAMLSADPAREGERTTLEPFRAAVAC